MRSSVLLMLLAFGRGQNEANAANDIKNFKVSTPAKLAPFHNITTALPPPLSFENFTLLPPFFLPFNTCFIVIYTRGMGMCSCTTTSRCVRVRACVCVQVCLI